MITRQVRCGDVLIGGGAPVSVQSMTNVDSRDEKALLRQLSQLTDAGCQIVRISVFDNEAAAVSYTHLVRGGYFANHYAIFRYDRMQVMNNTYHPVARRYGCGTGVALLLNFAAGIPYIKKELILEISEKMIGGTK